MKHGRHFRKLGKDASHRWAMIRTMVTQLIEHERIQTTVAKAKELRRVADRVVTFAKEGSLRARRKAAAVVRTDAAVNKLFTELAERYKERPGGSRACCRSASARAIQRPWRTSSTSIATGS